MATPGRRPIAFGSLEDVMPDVDRLLQGHTTLGNWSLGQICHHLTRAMVGSIEGYPMKLPWILRVTLGRVVLGRILSTQGMREGIKLPEDVLPKPGLDARAEAEALRAALRIYQAHDGPMAMHPFFGPMTREQWDRLHRIHFAHHLSFVLPSETGPPG